MTPSRRISRSTLRACFLVLLLPAVSLAEDWKTTLQDHWRKREAQFRTLDLAWREWSVMDAGDFATYPKDAGKWPDSHAYTRELSIDGNKMCLVYEGPRYIADEDRFVPMKYTSTFNERVSKALYDNYDRDSTNSAHRLGYIKRNLKNQDGDNTSLCPITLHVRPNHPGFVGFDLKQWTLIDPQAHLGDRKCIVLRQGDPNANHYTCWIDLERDASVVRYVGAVQSVTAFQIDTQFEKLDSIGWFPVSWSIVSRGPGREPGRERIIVQRFDKRLINAPIPSVRFDLQFPEKTEVYDQRNNTSWIVRPDGGQRFITVEERRRPGGYLAWVASPSGQAGLPPSSATSTFSLIAALLGLAGLLLILPWVCGRTRTGYDNQDG